MRRACWKLSSWYVTLMLLFHGNMISRTFLLTGLMIYLTCSTQSTMYCSTSFLVHIFPFHSHSFCAALPASLSLLGLDALQHLEIKSPCGQVMLSASPQPQRDGKCVVCTISRGAHSHWLMTESPKRCQGLMAQGALLVTRCLCQGHRFVL